MQKIYVAMHKPYTVLEEPLYVPLQVGAARQNAIFCKTCDDSGQNISEKNHSFCELTALYWMRYNSDAEVLGLVHYRRYFASKYPTHRNKWENVLGGEELETLMQSVDLVLPRKRNYIIETTFSHYAHAHHEKDLHAVRAVICEQCPRYLQAFDAVMRKRTGHRFNMFIMKREALHDYCDWLFPILFELEKRINTSDYDEYNKRVFGFIGERLLDVWLMNRAYRYAERKVLEIEKTNWINKGSCFVWRKIKGICRKSKGGNITKKTCK